MAFAAPMVAPRAATAVADLLLAMLEDEGAKGAALGTLVAVGDDELRAATAGVDLLAALLEDEGAEGAALGAHAAAGDVEGGV